MGMRTATVHECGLVERLRADTRNWILRAHGEASMVSRDTVGAGKRAEVRVEGAILLHDEDHVLDVLEAHEMG
jgi:hypothetical protein